MSSARSRPSLFRYSPALILIVIAITDMGRFADPDLWGHVRFGQAMLSQGHIVWRDPYSYSAPGHLWLNHEWLTELIMGALYNHLGVFGLKLLKLGCAALLVIFLAAAEAETGAPTLSQFAILVAAAAMIAPQVQFRPQIFTFAMLSALIFLLTREVYGRGAHLWIAVPMLAAWANLHGGFILGVATLAVYTLVCGVQDVIDQRGTARIRRLAAITGLAGLATLATPYGIGTWHAVIHALFNPYTRIVVLDWQPLTKGLLSKLRIASPAAIYPAFALALMAATFFSFIKTPTKDDLPLLAIAAMMFVAALISVRNLPVAIIAMVPPLTRHLPLALEHRWPAIRQDRGATHRASRLNQAVLAMLTLAILWGSDFFSNRLHASDPYPAGATTFMKDHGLKGNVLAVFGWGEYLIWHLAPESKVFMDGRYDTVYPQDVLEEFFWFNYNQPGGELAVTQYPTDFVLIPPNIGARRSMDSRKDWRLIYSDGYSRLYARADSPAAHLTGVPVTGSAHPTMFP